MLCLALVLAQEIDVSVWAPSFDGHLRFDEKPFRGDEIDDWGWDRAWSPSLKVSFEGLSLRLGYLRFHGREVFDAPQRWNESSFAAGEEVESEMKRWELGLGYELTLLSADSLDLRGGVRAAYYRTVVKTSAPTPGKDDDTLSAAIPAPGISLELRLGEGFSARGELAGIAFSAFDQKTLAYVADACLMWGPLAAGWRVERMDVVSTDSIQRNEIDVLLSGPILHLLFRF